MININESSMNLKDLKTILLKKFRRYFDDDDSNKITFKVSYIEGIGDYWYILINDTLDEGVFLLTLQSLSFSSVLNFSSGNNEDLLRNSLKKIERKYSLNRWHDSEFIGLEIETGNVNLIIKIIGEFIAEAEKINLKLKGTTGRKRL